MDFASTMMFVPAPSNSAHDACSADKRLCRNYFRFQARFPDPMNLFRMDIVRRALVTSFVLTLCWRRTSVAQIPGAPVLQNAWATPGLVGAVDFGGGPDGSVYAAAAAWAPASGRFQLCGGGGAQSRTGQKGSRGVFGVRAAIPFGSATGDIGFAVFAGVGGGNGGTSAFPDSISSTTEVPLGAAVGWRHTIGSNHGISVYATPAYVLFSGGSGSSRGVFRAALGSDIGVTSALGATLGVEFGGTRPRGFGGPSGTLYGVGVSSAFGHR